MTAGQYLLGVSLVAVTLASLTLAAVRVRRWIVPGWEGAPARLAELVVATAVLLAAAELLGCVGALRAGYLVAVCVAASLASLRLPAPAAPEPAPVARRSGRLELASAAAAGALVLVQWGSRSAAAFRFGMADPDSLWYHLPHAARFAQDGWTTRLQFTESEPITTFHPANAELLHGIGMSLMGGFDLLSPLVNLALAGGCLLAGWCVGRPFGAAPAAMTGVAAVLLTPIMLQTQPGEAYNDAAALAFSLAAAALFLNARGAAHGGAMRQGALVLAALAAGLALGTKLSVMAVAFALGAAALVACSKGERRRVAAIWLAGLAAGGGFWFVRNLVRVGNPLPWFAVHLGPLSLPAPPHPITDANSFSVAHYLADTGIWRRVFAPGLHASLGPVWELLALAAAGGALLALVAGRSRGQRALGAAALACLLAFLVTPASAGGPEGEASLFALNLRFVTPALALGLALGPAALGRGRRLAAPALLGLGLLTLLGEGLWPLGHAWAGLLVLVVATAALALLLAPPHGRRLVLAIGLTALVAAAAGWPLQRGYFEARYATGGPTVPSVSVWAARHLEHSRVGVVGYLLQYPLYGKRLTNRVDMLGEHGPHGAFHRFRGCGPFTRAVIAGRYRYVVAVEEGRVALGSRRRGPRREPPEARWTRSIEGAKRVMGIPGLRLSVFRLDDPRFARCT